MRNNLFDVAIIGAGPGGLSAAARAAQRGLRHILLEASDKHANTIQQYQKGKQVMAEPSVLPLRSDIEFQAGARESILDTWGKAIPDRGINIRYQAQVITIVGNQDDYCITLQCGDLIRAKNLVLALGVQGNPRRLNVPGEDLEFVQSTLVSAQDYQDERIVIVGAGDSAIENAIALSERNQVVLINRQDHFSRAKERNANQIRKAIDQGRITCYYQSRIDRIEAQPNQASCPGLVFVNTAGQVRPIECNRVITRLGASPPRALVESTGVDFVSDRPDALPRLSPQYESNVPGIYLIGAMAGFPLIKQAMNQGYEVIEYISGETLNPSDHSILLEKFRILPFGDGVEDRLESIKAKVDLLKDTNPLNLRELMLLSTIVTAKRGHTICAKGSYSSTFYTILDGSVEVFANGRAGKAVRLGEGQFFGELSLISGRRRSATVVAEKDCILLESPPSAIKKLMRMESSVRLKIDQTSIVRTIKLFLLPHAPELAVQSLAKEAEIHRLEPGEILFREGDAIGRVYLVRSGSMRLSRTINQDEVVVAYCAAGNYIDLVTLSGAGERLVTAQANVSSEILSINQRSFNNILKCDSALLKKVRQERKKQLAGFTQMQAEPERGELVSFFMAHGLGEATDVLIIDESLCIGCDNCEKACAATHHGISRLDRKAGPTFNSLHIPTSCRHCEHPHCMQDCPPDAIHRLENGEVYIDDQCIGCGNCVENCPYDVIQLAEIKPKTGFLDRLLGKDRRDAPKTAIKCDMCKDLKAGSACVNACPTGAAIRIHAEQTVTLANHTVALTNKRLYS